MFAKRPFLVQDEKIVYCLYKKSKILYKERDINRREKCRYTNSVITVRLRRPKKSKVRASLSVTEGMFRSFRRHLEVPKNS